MVQTTDAKTTSDTATQPPPLRVSRSFPAPPELVFKAWSSTDHVRRWFHPTGYSAPQGRVQMHVGGPFEICMRAPDGTEHWTRGTFVEVVPHSRLVLDLYAADAEGRRLFRCHTEVSFTAEGSTGTRMDVVQTYTFEDPETAAPMVAGAPMGWSQTLDKLDAEITRMRGGGVIARSVVHATFHLERTYDAPPALVFKALSEAAAKSRWFGHSDGDLEILERSMDFRVGGRERLRGRWGGGVVSTFDAVYSDIIPGERIVYTYEMHLDEAKISVSLATMQLKAAGPGRTTLMVTEQGAFLDGYDDAGSREHGTAGLLDRLGESLRA